MRQHSDRSERPGDIGPVITTFQLDGNNTFEEFRQAQRRNEIELDRLRNQRRQRILDDFSAILKGGGGWNFYELMHNLHHEDREFIAKIFPIFVQKLRVAYPDDGLGRLVDINGIRHILDLITAERDRPYAEMVAERYPSSDRVKAAVLERVGDVAKAELELELMALAKMRGIRKLSWMVVLLVARLVEFRMRRMRARLRRGAC